MFLQVLDQSGYFFSVDDPAIQNLPDKTD